MKGARNPNRSYKAPPIGGASKVLHYSQISKEPSGLGKEAYPIARPDIAKPSCSVCPRMKALNASEKKSSNKYIRPTFSGGTVSALYTFIGGST